MTVPSSCKPHQSVERLTATKWLILDNLKQGWPWRTNICDWNKADSSYLWLVENGYIEDGRITDKGLTALMFPLVADAS